MRVEIMSLTNSLSGFKHKVLQQLFAGNWKGKGKQKGCCNAMYNHLVKVKEGELSGAKSNLYFILINDAVHLCLEQITLMRT